VSETLTKRLGSETGQSLIETILITPLLLLIILNVVNFGYFFLAALNIAAAPRTGVEYGIVGGETPASLTLPSAGPPSTTSTISYLVQQDMTGAVYDPTSANLQICTPTNVDSTTKSGLNGTGTGQKSNCVSCTGTTCGSVGTGSPTPDADPEAPSFVLSRVDVDYSITPLIPGTPFGLLLLPISTCSASGGTVTCGFHRQVSMRAMN
jgi:Flp pilus assembly protein TadG